MASLCKVQYISPKSNSRKVRNMNNKNETLLSTDGKIQYDKSQRSSV